MKQRFIDFSPAPYELPHTMYRQVNLNRLGRSLAHKKPLAYAELPFI